MFIFWWIRIGKWEQKKNSKERQTCSTFVFCYSFGMNSCFCLIKPIYLLFTKFLTHWCTKCHKLKDRCLEYWNTQNLMYKNVSKFQKLFYSKTSQNHISFYCNHLIHWHIEIMNFYFLIPICPMLWFLCNIKIFFPFCSTINFHFPNENGSSQQTREI